MSYTIEYRQKIYKADVGYFYLVEIGPNNCRENSGYGERRVRDIDIMHFFNKEDLVKYIKKQSTYIKGGGLQPSGLKNISIEKAIFSYLKSYDSLIKNSGKYNLFNEFEIKLNYIYEFETTEFGKFIKVGKEETKKIKQIFEKLNEKERGILKIYFPGNNYSIFSRKESNSNSKVLIIGIKDEKGVIATNLKEILLFKKLIEKNKYELNTINFNISIREKKIINDSGEVLGKKRFRKKIKKYLLEEEKKEEKIKLSVYIDVKKVEKLNKLKRKKEKQQEKEAKEREVIKKTGEELEVIIKNLTENMKKNKLIIGKTNNSIFKIKMELRKNIFDNKENIEILKKLHLKKVKIKKYDNNGRIQEINKIFVFQRGNIGITNRKNSRTFSFLSFEKLIEIKSK